MFISSFFIWPCLHAASPAPVSTPETIYAAVNHWKEAWQSLDADTYLACYSPTFSSDEFSEHDQWVGSRRDRLANQQWIKVQLSGIVVFKRNDGKYEANFTQHYRSDTFSETSRKQLLFGKYPQGWLIVSEKELPAAQ